MWYHATLCWSQFFERSKEIYQAEILNQSSTWPLDELKLVKSRSYTNDNPNNPAVPLQDTEGGQSVPDKVPDEITDMVNKQFAEIPEVNIFLLFKDHVKSVLRMLTFQWSGPDRWNVINISYLLNFLELNL
jgi:hypothetical protein